MQIMQDASEIVHYDEEGIPIYIRRGILSNYPCMRALCHWHDDIEWIYIYSGEMEYEINGICVHLQVGDIIMVNSRQLHFGYSNDYKDCHFLCILFQPTLLYGNKKLVERFVTPYIAQSSPFYIFRNGTLENQCFSQLLQQLIITKELGHEDCLSEIIDLLAILWKETRLHISTHTFKAQLSTDVDAKIQKDMITFIQKNYSEAISLDDIAASGSVSRSKCCKLFKKYLSITPNEYLNTFRLEVAAYLLEHTTYNITQIATSCGFNHLSYFSKFFYQKYTVSPKEYRKFKHYNKKDDSPIL